MKVHMSLPTTNIEATTKFYSTLFGAEPVKVKSDYVKFDPAQPALNISFVQTDEIKHNSQHLGFQVADHDTLDALYKRLQDAGLVTQEKEAGICCYARQDKFWVTDPDGFKWELYVLLEDSDKKIDADSTCCPGSSSKAC